MSKSPRRLTDSPFERTEKQLNTMFGCAFLVAVLSSVLMLFAILAGVYWLWSAVL